MEGLARTGLRRLEVTSFVRADVIPQLADGAEVLRRADIPDEVDGVGADPQRARARATRSRCATASTRSTSSCPPSETHNRKNVNRSIEESLAGLERVIGRAREEGLRCEGVISVSFGCPYEGEVPRGAGALDRADGWSKPAARRSPSATRPAWPTRARCASSSSAAGALDAELTAHFHNTRGQGLANVLAALEAGVRSFESSFGELGGCPVPPGATGNIATEDLVSMLHEMGHATGIDLERLLAARARCAGGSRAPAGQPRAHGRARGLAPSVTLSADVEALAAMSAVRRARVSASPRSGARDGCATLGAQEVRTGAVPLPAALRLRARPPLRRRAAPAAPRRRRRSLSFELELAAGRSGCGGCCRRGRARTWSGGCPRGASSTARSCSWPTTMPPTPG